jgi:hypothetical protein
MTASAFTILNLLSNTSCLDGESLKKRRVLGGWSTSLSGGLSMFELACSFIIRPPRWCQSYCTTMHLQLSRAEIYAILKYGAKLQYFEGGKRAGRTKTREREKKYHLRSGNFPFPLLDSNRYRVTSSMSWIGKSTFDVPSLALALTLASPLLFLSSAFISQNGKLG